MILSLFEKLLMIRRFLEGPAWIHLLYFVEESTVLIRNSVLWRFQSVRQYCNVDLISCVHVYRFSSFWGSRMGWTATILYETLERFWFWKKYWRGINYKRNERIYSRVGQERWKARFNQQEFQCCCIEHIVDDHVWGSIWARWSPAVVSAKAEQWVSYNNGSSGNE